jgi:phosphatidylglycerophosphatase A
MKFSESPGRVFSDPIVLIAFGFGSGLAPFAPGTAGTLVGVVTEWWLRQASMPWRIAAVIVGFAAGVWICHYAAGKLAVHDHPGIVWDEIVGYWITMLAAPATSLLVPAGWLWMALGFGLFRLFDIVKPWPIRDVDHRIGGGLGIMLDDVLAGIYAAACLLLLRFLWPEL